jgi:hypothetical protein
VCVQAPAFGLGEIARPVGGAQPGAPQDLVGEQIAESGQDGLIGEYGLDAAAVRGQRVLELRTVHRHRVGALPVQQPYDIGVVVGQPETLQLALVPVAELTVAAHGEQDAVVGLGRIVGMAADQLTGHAEVQDEGGAAGVGEQPLPVPLRLGEPPAFQRVAQPPRAHPVQDARVAHVDASDGPALHTGFEHLPESLDVRQLWHGVRPLSSTLAYVPRTGQRPLFRMPPAVTSAVTTAG